jgi:hypothetical protein
VGSGVPAAVLPGAVSALARAVAVIVAFALDAVARLAVFWPHPLAAGRAWRVLALAVAELSADPVPASREADPALAGASGPTRCSATVAQLAAGEQEPRSDELPEEELSDWVVVVAKRYSNYRDVPQDGHSEGCSAAVCSGLPACWHSDWHHSAARADRCDGLEAAEGYSLLGADWFALVPEWHVCLPDDRWGDYPEDCWAARSLAPLSEETYSRQVAD